MNATKTYSIQIAAANARKTQGRRERNRVFATMFRDAFGREPDGLDFKQFHEEVERQQAIHAERERNRGNNMGGLGFDRLAMRAELTARVHPGYKGGFFACQAMGRRANLIKTQAVAQLRSGERSYSAMEAAGLSHLIDKPITVSRRGTVAVVEGNKCITLSETECELLGRKAGPGNY